MTTLTTFWRMTVTLAVLGVIALVQPTCVFACSCLPPGPPADELGKATAVFAGKVTAVSAPADMGGADPVVVTFAVSRAWKGVDQATIEIRTPASSAACGVNFEQDQEYLVYASESEGVLQTGLCSRTTQFANANDDLAALGEGTVPGGTAGGAAGGSGGGESGGSADTPVNLPATGATATNWLSQRNIQTGAALLLIVVGAAVSQRRFGRVE